MSLEGKLSENVRMNVHIMIRWKVKKSTLQHHYHALSLQFFPHIYSPSLFMIVVEMRPRKDCVMIWSGCVGGKSVDDFTVRQN